MSLGARRLLRLSVSAQATSGSVVMTSGDTPPLAYHAVSGAWFGERDISIALKFEDEAVEDVELSLATSRELLWRLHVPAAASASEFWQMSGEDCQDFAWALAMANHPRGTASMRQCSERPGCVVLLESLTLGAHHYAFVLGNGFYVSLLRPFSILVQTLAQLEAFWRPTDGSAFLRPSRLCKVCPRISAPSLRCIACCAYGYCSQVCRAAHWREHRSRCSAQALFVHEKKAHCRTQLLALPKDRSAHALLTSFAHLLLIGRADNWTLLHDALGLGAKKTAFFFISERALSAMILVLSSCCRSFVFIDHGRRMLRTRIRV